MKHWKCKYCYREKDSEDNVIMVICSGCQELMEEVKGGL